MTAAPLAPAPSIPCPHRDPTVPQPRRPRMRAPGHEPEPLPAGTVRGAAVGGGPAAVVGSDPAAPVVGSAAPPVGIGPAASVLERGSAARLARQDRDGAGAEAPPRPHAHAAALARAVVEVLAGRRPPSQLAAAVSPEVLRYLAAGRPPSARAAGTGRVHVRQPHPGAAEVVAVCRIGDRTRALALRLDRDPATGHGDRQNRWTCTAARLL